MQHIVHVLLLFSWHLQCGILADLVDKRFLLQNDTDLAQQVSTLSRDMGFLKQEVAVLKSELQTKDAAIAALQQENRQKNATVLSLDQELNMMRRTIQMLDSNVTSEQRDIFKLQQDLLQSNFTQQDQGLSLNTLQQQIQVIGTQQATNGVEIIALQRETRHTNTALSAQENNLTEVKQAMQDVKSELTSLHQNLTSVQQALDQDIATMKADIYHENATLAKVEKDIHGINSDLANKSQKIAAVEKELDLKADIDDMGSTFIRWGRTTCGGAGNFTHLTYKGYVSGPRYNERGSGSNMLCLPEYPTWAQYHSGGDIGGHLYGSEYYSGFSSLFNPFGFKTHEKAACAVCRTGFSSTMMVPGTSVCQSGWTLQYTGYLMSGYYEQNATSEYICVDAHPEKTAMPDSGGEHGNLLYFVQAKCGVLPCQRYPEGRQLACAVCSK